MTWTLYHDGKPVHLPHVAEYERADDRSMWYASVFGIMPPDPTALGLQARNRGVVQVVHGPTPTGPWGPPYYGADPADYGLEIKEEEI